MLLLTGLAGLLRCAAVLGQLADPADTITLESYVVELFYIT